MQRLRVLPLPLNRRPMWLCSVWGDVAVSFFIVVTTALTTHAWHSGQFQIGMARSSGKFQTLIDCQQSTNQPE